MWYVVYFSIFIILTFTINEINWERKGKKEQEDPDKYTQLSEDKTSKVH